LATYPLHWYGSSTTAIRTALVFSLNPFSTYSKRTPSFIFDRPNASRVVLIFDTLGCLNHFPHLHRHVIIYRIGTTSPVFFNARPNITTVTPF